MTMPLSAGLPGDQNVERPPPKADDALPIRVSVPGARTSFTDTATNVISLPVRLRTTTGWSAPRRRQLGDGDDVRVIVAVPPGREQPPGGTVGWGYVALVRSASVPASAGRLGVSGSSRAAVVVDVVDVERSPAAAVVVGSPDRSAPSARVPSRSRAGSPAWERVVAVAPRSSEVDVVTTAAMPIATSGITTATMAMAGLRRVAAGVDGVTGPTMAGATGRREGLRQVFRRTSPTGPHRVLARSFSPTTMPVMRSFLSTVRAVRRRRGAARDRRRSQRREVCVVGPGKAFLSGMTYHSYRLVEALGAHGPVSMVALRNLVPSRAYPGRSRIGADLSHLRLPPDVRRLGAIDWWWGMGMVRTAARLLARPPAVVVIQWWSAAVWHTEVALAAFARLRGARVVIEVHELMDTGEQRHPLSGVWAGTFAPLLMGLADRVVVHNREDRGAIVDRYGKRRSEVVVIAEPPFDHYAVGGDAPVAEPVAERDDRPVELLCFGVIRPYKGVEDLVSAFDLLRSEGEREYRLTIVGETWEGWTVPASRIARSTHADDITFVNRYVTDEEVDEHFRRADLVVLPYRRSSTSGPLQVAMSYGLPVVVTAVGGLPEAVEPYGGAVLVEAGSVVRLAEGIRKADPLLGIRHRIDRTWADAAAEHEALYRGLGVGGRS